MRKKAIQMLIALLYSGMAYAQGVHPESYDIEHSDSSWYVTVNYRIAEMPSNDELILLSRICCPDTCINDSVRRFQGRRYAKRYARRHGHRPILHSAGKNSITFVVPEEHASDTLTGITYCEYTTHDGTTGYIDTTQIILPPPTPLCCRPVHRMQTTADRYAATHPYVCSMQAYSPLDGGSAHIPTNPATHIYFAMNSPLFEPSYCNNAATIDSLASTIITLASDPCSRIEAIQIIGYTAPDRRDETTPRLGYKRATALRNHLQRRCNLPDSLFEVADGGKHWHMIYSRLHAMNNNSSDSLARLLQNEKSPKKRIALLRTFNGGKTYKALAADSIHTQCGACCARIYYHNLPDSGMQRLNSIVAELKNNPAPDYDSLCNILMKHENDPRAQNIIGVIEYRRHRNAAAAKAFHKAALMGDSQATTNIELSGLGMD